MFTDKTFDPPALVAYELGYRRTFFEKLYTSCTLYWHEYNDTLGTTAIYAMPPKESRQINDNIGSCSTHGFEFESRYAITRQLTLLGNYTLQFLDWRSNENFAMVMDSPTPPRHKFMIGPRYSPTDNLHFSSQLWFVDQVEAPNPGFPFAPKNINEYYRWDLRAEYEFWKKRASIAVGVQNLIDPEHQEATSSFEVDGEVPRMIYLELRMNLK